MKDVIFPSKRERSLKSRLEAAERRLGELLSDSSGATVIAGLEAQITELEDLAREYERLKVKHANLQEKNSDLKKTSNSLKKEISALRADVAYAHEYSLSLEREVKLSRRETSEWVIAWQSLTKEISDLKAENKKLKTQLNRNSDNSSAPPSESKKRKKISNSREKTGKKPGAQIGHTGHRRRQYTPDETVVFQSADVCPVCSTAIDATSAIAKSKTLTDLVITVKTTKYVSRQHTCTSCGHHIAAVFPEGVVNESNYGNNLRAVLTFLVNYCNVSIDNAITFLYEATAHKLKVSKGSVHNFLASFSDAATADIAFISKHINASAVVGSDATYVKASGRQTYIYNFNTDDAAYYLAAEKKGIEPLRLSPISSFGGTLIHDHDVSYYSFGGSHAECNAHILRYLKGVMENEPGITWAGMMRELLSEANELAHTARSEGAGHLEADTIRYIENRYDLILDLAEKEYEAAGPYNPKYKPEGITLYLRLREYNASHLAFIHDLSIPFTNNASERGLRPAKKKLKQSGGFRSVEKGQSYYCDFLTIAQTARLKNIEVLGAVRDVFDGKQVFSGEQAAGSPPADP
jgi:cell division protein FtsB